MSEGTLHTARANYFERETTWRLAPDALECERDPARLLRFPYAQIAEVRLAYDPTRLESKRYRCDVVLDNGARQTIRSSHFVGVAKFEDRAATYTPLVRNLIARVAAANPACAFRAGKTPLVYWAQHAFLLSMLALLVLVLAAFGGYGLGELILIKLAIVIVMVPLALAYARKNRPRAFSPGALPSDVLPSASH